MQENSNSSTTRRIRRALVKYNVLTHACGFLVAMILSFAAIGCALFILIHDYLHPELQSSAWAEVTVAFILGIWLTNRPKFLKQKKYIQDQQQQQPAV